MLHIKGVRSLFIIATALVVLPLAVQAEDSFSKDGVGASRTPAELYGGQVSDVDIAADGRFYAALNSPNGIFTSTNSGQTWQGPNANNDLGQVLQVEVSDETNTAYIIAGVGLHKTSDAGAIWTDLTTASETATGDYDHALGYFRIVH